MIFVFLILLTVSLGRGKVYKRCELAKELKNVHNAPMHQLATWVCIAEHESQYMTDAVGHLGEKGTADHGIFQINDKYWCSPPGQGRACGLNCSKLEDDDITDDFKCAQKIYNEHKILSGDGFNAWAVYVPHCKGSKARKYLKGCFGESNNTSTGTEKPGRQRLQSSQIPEIKEKKKSSWVRTETTSPAFGTFTKTTTKHPTSRHSTFANRATTTTTTTKAPSFRFRSKPEVTTKKYSLANRAETITNFKNTVVNDVKNTKYVNQELGSFSGQTTYTKNFVNRNSKPPYDNRVTTQSPSNEESSFARPVFIFNNRRWY